jgi:hypothetical protein
MSRAKRNYQKEYQEYHKHHLKDNNARHRDRYAAEKAGKVHVGDGKEIDHIDNKPQGGKTRVVSRKFNRARKRRKII